MAKELVVYFSVYGTAKLVAEEIAKQTGADIAKKAYAICLKTDSKVIDRL